MWTVTRHVDSAGWGDLCRWELTRDTDSATAEVVIVLSPSIVAEGSPPLHGRDTMRGAAELIALRTPDDADPSGQWVVTRDGVNNGRVAYLV